jgi:hypothetical protein
LAIETLQRLLRTDPAELKGIDNGYEFRDYDESGTQVSGYPDLSVAFGCK